MHADWGDELDKRLAKIGRRIGRLYSVEIEENEEENESDVMVVWGRQEGDRILL